MADLVNDVIFTAPQLKENELTLPVTTGSLSAGQVNRSAPFPPQQLMLLFSAYDWEVFISEWAYYQKHRYHLVAGLGGSNDYGVDVACFSSNKGFLGEWDNYQCKRYLSSPLAPNEAIPEVGKILWHIFNGRLTTPSNYYFFSPKDVGPSLKKLLLNPFSLKNEVKSKWDKWCSKSITTTEVIPLIDDFLVFVDSFDFSIFQYKPHLEVIDEHRNTPYHIERFGGGLKDRPISQIPPESPDQIENRYIEQLYEAYSDNQSIDIKPSDIKSYPKLSGHLNRSRETFYEAESLKAFARDSVPEGTFRKLQDQIYHGVIDVEEDEHDDGLKRLNEVTRTAVSLNVNASGLIGVIELKDLKGICHQLANDDRLTWRK